MSWLQLGQGNCIDPVSALLLIHVRSSTKPAQHGSLGSLCVPSSTGCLFRI